MYSFTNEKEDYYIHIACECGRRYRAEEMYICYKYENNNNLVVKKFSALTV